MVEIDFRCSKLDCAKPTRESRDLLSQPWMAILLYCVPAAVIVLTARADIGDRYRTIAWTASLLILGIACLANSARCRRTHCYFTGPFFLLMALVTVLYGTGLLRLNHGWNLIGMGILVGTVLLCCIPEALWGKYRDRGPRA